MFDLWRSDSYVGQYPVIMACLTWWQCHRTERTTSCVPTWASGYPGSMSAMETMIVPTTPMKLTAILVSVWENWTFTLTDIFHWHPMLPPIVLLLRFYCANEQYNQSPAQEMIYESCLRQLELEHFLQNCWSSEYDGVDFSPKSPGLFPKIFWEIIYFCSFLPF